ncbi:MAG: PTS transporter subunit EIIC, partial [Candidatus Calescibacterium sp.]|nr:PTS transporter subunit EIIC [Candidatus Calescibacterium sp.]
MEYQKLINFLSNIEKISAFPFIIILRNSMINIVPIIIVGSFFLLFFVLMRQYGIATEYLEFFRKLYLLTMGFVSVYLSISIGYNYANYYDRDRIIYCLVSLVCFLVSVLIYHDWKNYKATEFVSFLGVKNMFSAIIISLLSCYVFSKVRIDMFMDKSVPDYIRSSLNYIVPFFITIFFVSLLAFFLRFNEFLTFLLVPFERYGDNILVVWVTNIFLHLTNFLGIHGISL